MTSDTLYCPRCDTPLDVQDDEDDYDRTLIVNYTGVENRLASVRCPLCKYRRSAIERTLCECWAIIEADMDRERSL